MYIKFDLGELLARDRWKETRKSRCGKGGPVFMLMTTCKCVVDEIFGGWRFWLFPFHFPIGLWLQVQPEAFHRNKDFWPGCWEEKQNRESQIMRISPERRGTVALVGS